MVPFSHSAAHPFPTLLSECPISFVSPTATGILHSCISCAVNPISSPTFLPTCTSTSLPRADIGFFPESTTSDPSPSVHLFSQPTWIPSPSLFYVRPVRCNLPASDPATHVLHVGTMRKSNSFLVTLMLCFLCRFLSRIGMNRGQVSVGVSICFLVGIKITKNTKNSSLVSSHTFSVREKKQKTQKIFFSSLISHFFCVRKIKKKRNKESHTLKSVTKKIKKNKNLQRGCFRS